jgi:hypothetical protein
MSVIVWSAYGSYYLFITRPSSSNNHFTVSNIIIIDISSVTLAYCTDFPQSLKGSKLEVLKVTV